MTHLPQFVITAVHSIIYFKYLLIFLGVVVEGPIIMISSGFLLHLGYFSFIPLFISLVLGDLVGDVAWYYIGHFYGESFVKKYGKFFGLNVPMFEKTKSAFSRNHKKIMFISKMFGGFGVGVYILMIAGAARVKLKTLLIINSIGEVFFVGMLVAIGYYFGELFNIFDKGIRVTIFISFLPIAIFLLIRLGKYLREVYFARK